MSPLTTREELDAALAAPLAILYKHSTRCPVSLDAWHEVARFTRRRPDVPVFVVDVVERRPLAREIAERTGVTHQSPQAIILRQGRRVWHGSHYAITAQTLEDCVGPLGAAAGGIATNRPPTA